MDPEKELLDRFTNKDKTAWETIFKRYYGMLSDKAWYILGNVEESQGMVAECYIKMWQSKSKPVFTSIPELEQYLKETIRSVCFDELKRKNKQLEVYLDLDLINHDSEKIEPAEVETAMRQYSMDEIRKEVENLPPQCSLIFKMRYIDHLKVGDISAILKIKRTSIYSQLDIARNRLQKKFPGITLAFTGWLLSLLIKNMLLAFLLINTQKSIIPDQMKTSYKLHAM